MRTLVWLVNCPIPYPSAQHVTGEKRSVHEQLNDAIAQLERKGATILDVDFVENYGTSTSNSGMMFLIRYTMPEELFKTDMIESK